MRLTVEQRNIVRKTASEVFGEDVDVYLFGSRVDDTAKGGDVDLLVESNKPIPDSLAKTLTMTARLQLRLGDQKIDVVAHDPQMDVEPIYQHAKNSGVRIT
ncbi:MAG: nucleotidyltransferase domain-containing protein [Pseudomonadota bacterium]